MYRQLLTIFCADEDEALDYRLTVPVVHNRLPYGRLVYDPVTASPVLLDEADGWVAGIENLSEDEARQVLVQAGRDRAARLRGDKQLIVDKIGIGRYADELRRVEDIIEAATIYA